MIFQEDVILDLCVCSSENESNPTPFLLQWVPLWLGAILWISAHAMSFQDVWTQHALREWHACIPQTCLWQIRSSWMKFLSLFHTSFTLISYLWVLMSRSFLGRWREFLSSASWGEKSQRCTCVCVHMPSRVQICARICTHMCIRWVRTHAPVCTCVCAPASMCLYVHATRS